MRRQSFSLLELMLLLSITCLCYVTAIAPLQSLSFRVSGMLTLRKLELAINYARSIAVRYKVKTFVSITEHTIIVSAPSKSMIRRETYPGKRANLSFYQSGRNQRLVIEPNGMTHSNGHFTYSSTYPSGLPQFKLYFNKALRLYTLEDEN